MQTKKIQKREKMLDKLWNKRDGFKYLRIFAITISNLILLAIPLLKFARVDLWRGNHYFLMRETTVVYGLAGVIGTILSLYLFTFATNFFLRRMFCGWGCPVGFLGRLGEKVDISQKDKFWYIFHLISGGAFSATFAISIMFWWTDWRILIDGTPKELGIFFGIFATILMILYLHGKKWRFTFCKVACPIGIYYSVVSKDQGFTVYYNDPDETCTGCTACELICPVDLNPRTLDLKVKNTDENAVQEMLGHDYCLNCGDCVDVCHIQAKVRNKETIPLRFGWNNKGRSYKGECKSKQLETESNP
ncbi:MAG: 4Fe-4S binding protein [Calditrichaeota bacterium]|nr:MAG: 4Fe-4S binding protein [Calditrichota bacterium]